jgi:hypothetical protein
LAGLGDVLRLAVRPIRGNELSETRLAGLGLAPISLFLFTLVAFSPHVLRDGDTWSDVATGEWIVARDSARHADPFSHSMAGDPWTAHEWLSAVLLSLAFRLGGWNGVVLLTSAAAALAALIVGLSAARELRGAPLIATVAIGLSLLMANLLARPHVLTLPLAAAWGAGLINRIVAALDREPGRRRLYADATAVVHVRDTALGRKGLGRNDRAREKEQRKLGPKAR